MQTQVVYYDWDMHRPTISITIPKGTVIFYVSMFELERISNCKAIVHGDSSVYPPTTSVIEYINDYEDHGSCGVIYDLQDGFYFAIVD